MNLSSSLSNRQKRSLAITSQLRQAITLLQFNNIELHGFLVEKAKENPYLEVRLSASDRDRTESVPPSEVARRGAAQRSQDTLGDSVAGPSVGLTEHVAEQIRYSISTRCQRHIAFAFLEALEPHGWLGETVETIAGKAGCTIADAEAVLALLQQCEPTGLFARSLAECLRLQAQEQGVLTEVMSALLRNLPLVAEGELGVLAEACDCDMEELHNNLALLRRFDPKPGNSFGAEKMPIREPDLLLFKSESGWAVELNSSTLPEIKVRTDGVANVSKRGTFVAEALVGARGLKRAVELRNANTLVVASEIVRRQLAFLKDSTAFLAPLKLRDVADTVALHPSTVSRITKGMTIQTLRGQMELREFFARGLLAAPGKTPVSTAAIKARIRHMIDGEEHDRPLSDAKLTRKLQEAGIRIQRRTVAKYRATMNIPDSASRRRGRLGLALR